MMNSMEKKETFVSAPLLKLEIRIAEHFESAARNLLGVGRCLNEARENDLVPHGQWEAWVRRVTGMDIRKAQRLMQAAREVPEGSAMAGLPITKITAILALPEGQREEMAKQARDESLTVRELKKRIDELDQQRKDALREQARRVNELNSRLDKRHQMIIQLDNARIKLEERVQELQANIDELIKGQGEVIDEEVREQVEARVADMRRELEEAKAFAARQAELRQEAQQELLNAGMSQKRAEPEILFGAYELEQAVRAFITSAGAMPHMAAELSKLGAAERSSMKISLERIGSWLAGATKALETVVIEDA